MRWAEIQITTRPENEEIISNILYDVGANGLSIEDPRDILELSKDKEAWALVDLSKLNLDRDTIIIKAYFSEGEDLDNIVNDIEYKISNNPSLEDCENNIILTMVDDEDFAENWKQYYKPTRLGQKIVIKPSWEDYQLSEGDIMIELDPGMAFGTGTHETTAMCTEALERYVKVNDRVYDIGCGSGILSIVAAKLGASKVVGVDLDEVSVKVSNENIILNRVEDIVEIKKGNLLDVVEGKANIIVSNIIAEIIVEMIGDLKNHLEEDGIFITSGIIKEKISLVENKLKDIGFTIIEIIEENGWALIVASL